MGDEPGITRDRLYGDIEWAGRKLRVVDTGGIVPDDKALIPSEIFRQARVALEEADAIVMVVDGRTELASPDIDLARLLLRTGKPLLLAVNKVDTPQAGALRRGISPSGDQGAVSRFPRRTVTASPSCWSMFWRDAGSVKLRRTRPPSHHVLSANARPGDCMRQPVAEAASVDSADVEKADPETRKKKMPRPRKPRSPLSAVPTSASQRC